MKPLEPVLLVTPFFAPQSHAAVFRAYRLAKYLPRYGFRPVVLTTAVNYNYNEDASLLGALPPEVEVHRARFVEPSVRGLRMALGGRDRSFWVEKQRLAQPGGKDCGEAPLSQAPKHREPSLPQRAYRTLLERWARVPDRFWPWRGPALRLARRLREEHNIRLVYTTCAPYTALEIGIKLKSEGMRWVCDFRDPTTYSRRGTSDHAKGFWRQRLIEREALIAADEVTGLSSTYGAIFRDIHGAVRQEPVEFIPTGLDGELLEQAISADAPPVDHPYLLFTGEFLEEYDASFFMVLDEALKRPEIWKSELRLYLVGHAQKNRALVLPLLQSERLRERVSFVDHQPLPELYRWLRGAQAGVLNLGQRAFWWTNSAKLVDYVAMQKPVLAMVPNPSEARRVLEATGLGIFLEDEPVQRLVSFLNRTSPSQPNAEACKPYLAEHMTAHFARIFRRALDT